jgi:hypothetical protein
MTQKGLYAYSSSTKQEMRSVFFVEKYKEKLATSRFMSYSLRMVIPTATTAADEAALALDIEKEMQRISAMSNEEFVNEFMNGKDYPYGECDPYENYNWRDDR